MVAHDGADLVGGQGERGDVEARLGLGPADPAGHLAAALDHDDGLQAGPAVAVLEPCDVVDDGDGAGLDAAVIAIVRGAAADRGIPEIVGYLLGGEALDVLAQSALIAFEGEDVVGAPLEDLARDGALAAHGVDGHDGALDRQQVEQLRDRHDLVGLVGDPDLPSARRWRAAKAETMCSAALSPLDRRAVFASIATTPSGTPATDAAQAAKQRWKRSASAPRGCRPDDHAPACLR